MSDGWIAPEYSKSRVKEAGKKIRDGNYSIEDLAVLENWRRAHAFVQNTHQMRIRRTQFLNPFTVAQRLKRHPTIVDKLSREPNMQLSTMHDIAGCRAIFNSVSDLIEFRTRLLSGRAKHRHINNDSNKFDYIKNPKSSGYRGIHDVFEHYTSRPSKWIGLRVEVQLRTRPQHAWATAVETIDLLNNERAKFGGASDELSRLFEVTSEIIARAIEDMHGPLPDLTNTELISELQSLERVTGVLRRLKAAAAQNPRFAKNRHTILIFHFNKDIPLEVRTFESLRVALDAYENLEQRLKGLADIVLVRATKTDELKRAFQNYFSDAGDFLHYVEEGQRRLC